MTDKITIADTTVRSFTSLEDWQAALKDSGHQFKTIQDEQDDTEYFAEKTDDDDVTMIGYFKKDWGMLV